MKNLIWLTTTLLLQCWYLGFFMVAATSTETTWTQSQRTATFATQPAATFPLFDVLPLDQANKNNNEKERTNDKVPSSTSQPLQMFMRRPDRSPLMLWFRRTCRQQWNIPSDRFHLFSPPSRSGTVLARTRPTSRRVSEWFWGTGPIRFNHAHVGMTNPYLHISVPSQQESPWTQPQEHANAVQLVALNSLKQTDPKQVSIASSSTLSNNDKGEMATAWWPQGPWTSIVSSSSSSSWRVLCFRKRVGYGEACYERVKQAALSADFDLQGKGIVSVVPPPQRHDDKKTKYRVLPPNYHRFSLPHDPRFDPPGRDSVVNDWYPRDSNDHTTPIWPGGGRRLVTFTRALGGCLWAVSPVSIVYELEDQTPPGSPTRCQKYSSTAFATCQGHWLSGEERVTVLLRQPPSHSSHHAPAVDVEILSLSRPANSIWGRMVWPIIGSMQRQFFVQQLNALEREAEQSTQTHNRLLY